MRLNASERYPAAPLWVRGYMTLYPVAVIALATWFSDRSWLWAVAVLCGLAWIGAVSVFLATTFRRDGYQAAIDDLTNCAQP